MKELSSLTYKNIPLARCGDTIFFGDSSKDRVVRIDIVSKKSFRDVDIPEKLTVKLLSTSVASKGGVGHLKVSEKNSLYDSLDLAFAWLERLA